MKCHGGSRFAESGFVLVSISLLLLLSCSTTLAGTFPADQTATGATPDSPEVIQARKVIKKKLERNPDIKKVVFHLVPDEIRYIGYSDRAGHDYVVELPALLLDSISASYSPGSTVTYPAWRVSYTEYIQMHEYFWLTSSWSQSDAEEIVRTLKILALDARSDLNRRIESNLEKFKVQCQSWRAAQAQNPMPAEARRHKLLAEAAYREKDLAKAADEYYAALGIYPCWPDGQFNAGSVLGETGWYTGAIAHMRRYLELLPDAPDAQAVREKIRIWQEKISH